ncbi:MAG: hypothetical protein GY797_39645 [Deltaproteobacteria bacterium]|nr:hypothetical protein [Deltaproteobacteria bacterium]
MKLIGRDKILEREIAPRTHKRTPFVLVGQRGIGKSMVLKWAYDEYKKNKIYLKSTNTYSHNLREIAKAQGIEGYSKKKNTDLEIEIIKGKELAVFIDNIERATPKLITFLTSINEMWKIFMAGVEPFREELTRIMWGKKKIKILAIEKKFRTKLAEEVINNTGSMINRNTIAVESRGVPARAWALARGEVPRDDAERVEGEEINIAPVLLIAVVGVVVLRYIGMGMGEKDLYILGGLGMGAALFMRYFIFQAMKK